jgi:WD40 repeat protein
MLAAAMLLVAACSDGAPAPVASGPRIEAALDRLLDRSDSPARESVFSRDGRLLATTSASGAVTVRRVGDWRRIAAFTHPGGATSADFSADGRRLYTGGYDGAVRAWDLGSGTSGETLREAQGTVWSLDVAPDGRRLAAAGEDKLVRIWTLGSDARPTRLAGHGRNIWEVRFSPDGTHLASGSFDTEARVWNLATGTSERVLKGHREAVVGLAYSPDGSLIATAGDDSTIRLWRSADGSLVRTIENGNHAYKIGFSADGRWIVSAGRARGGIGTFWHQLTGGGGAATPVRLWRVADGALVQALPHPDDVIYAAFSPDGAWLVTGGEDGAVRLWRVRESRGR